MYLLFENLPMIPLDTSIKFSLERPFLSFWSGLQGDSIISSRALSPLFLSVDALWDAREGTWAVGTGASQPPWNRKYELQSSLPQVMRG